MQYSTGTISGSQDSNLITGTGTEWLNNAAAGDLFVPENGQVYVVSAVTSDTALELTANLPADLVSATYTIHRRFTPNLKLPLLDQGDLRADALVSRALVRIDTALNAGLTYHAAVLDLLATPPGAPTTGDRYLVTATATGAWAGYEDYIAEWDGSAWTFTQPAAPAYVWDADSSQFYVYEAGGWSAWTITTKRIERHAVHFFGVLAATAAGNAHRLQAEFYMHEAGTITSIELHNVDGLDPAAVSGNTVFEVTTADYTGGTSGHTLTVAYNESKKRATLALAVTAGQTVRVWVSSAAGNHNGAHLSVRQEI